MGLFSYLNQLSKTKFTGVIELPFQNGKLCNFKEQDAMSYTIRFESTDIRTIQDTIASFLKARHYGVLKIPFINGVPGRPIVSKTIKAEDL